MSADVLLDVTDLVRENISLLADCVPPQLTLRAELAPVLPPVNGRTHTLRQMIMELLINAVEATEREDGEIIVRTAVRTFEAAEAATYWNHIAAVVPGNFVYLTVRDNGSGMPSAILARALEPGFSTKSPERGLGLAFVSSCVAAYGGGLRINSQPGKGTAVDILLPFATQTARAGQNKLRNDLRSQRKDNKQDDVQDLNLNCAAEGDPLINKQRGNLTQLVRQSRVGVYPDGKVAALTNGAEHLTEGPLLNVEAIDTLDFARQAGTHPAQNSTPESPTGRLIGKYATFKETAQ